MKNLRVSFLCLVATMTATSLSAGGAQTVDMLMMQWQHEQIQNSATTTVDSSATPYSFRVTLEGPDEAPLTADTFSSTPTLISPSGGVGSELAYSNDHKRWVYESAGYTSMSALVVNHPESGTYTMNLAGSSLSNPGSVTFEIPSGLTSNLSTPLVTLTNGTWVNGNFLVTDVNAPITMSFNSVYTGTAGSTDSYHFDVGLYDQSGGPGIDLTGGITEGFINYDPIFAHNTAPSAISGLTVAASQLIDGSTYALEVNYSQLMHFESILGSTANAVALSGNSLRINIITQLSAVPEPSTYALLGGLVALVGVVMYRRKGPLAVN